MNATEPRRRWWPRSVRARTALTVTSAAAVILLGIGWWLHHDVYRQGTRIAEGQAEQQVWALVDQLNGGVLPAQKSIVLPYEVVATGRRTAVAYGGGMEALDPGTRHVLPTPSGARGPGVLTIFPLRIPERGSHSRDRSGLVGRTFTVMYADVSANELSRDQVAALGVTSDALLRVYVVVLPKTAEEIARTTDLLLLRAGLVSLVLIAAAVYFTVRRSLRPVEAIRVLTASVTANDPRERVTVPATDTRSPPWPPPSTAPSSASTTPPPSNAASSRTPPTNCAAPSPPCSPAWKSRSPTRNAPTGPPRPPPPHDRPAASRPSPKTCCSSPASTPAPPQPAPKPST